MFFSVIIPVYNRPEEIRELLESLKNQSFKQFEVIVMDDGSVDRADEVCTAFKNDFSISYYNQPNQGQGFARNDGMRYAQGDFFVILDSDVLLPAEYLEELKMAIQKRELDAFGGPDAAEQSFSPIQKAMDFAMTSFWTTGGIRGKLKDPAKYQARGFNMGVSRNVFESIGGFVDPNKGEDIEWSIRIKKAGFKLELVEEAFVFHKRKNTLISFAKQAFSFGRNRVNVSRYHPDAIKKVHFLPTLFVLFCIGTSVSGLLGLSVFPFQLSILILWSLAVVVDSSIKYRSIIIGIYSLITSFTQLFSYGTGLVYELIRKQVKG
ncbi:glycosyltransferase involved in cell wall biosynthesis [Algoriphagus iocasae]|uniref:Glycosyltransferase involved in cell wall biosynthesis n=1 Tax=Algoriphagus iocasae TaxID=1836499 RepID=A0A841MSZ5_9BACT|nr:glycosyltransferase [Algoriphagus iocasae]MBB6328677.1 glycosyltransferase involved in cell wall biosynthesis [Algoriphagus iocasae]